MTLQELLDWMPSGICKYGRHFNLFIAKGTRSKDRWVVGYSDYEKELTNPIEDYDLRMALSVLKAMIEDVN